MATVLLFWNTNMAAVTSCENALFSYVFPLTNVDVFRELKKLKKNKKHMFQFRISLNLVPRVLSHPSLRSEREPGNQVGFLCYNKKVADVNKHVMNVKA